MGGISGHICQHSDIGGYTDIPPIDLRSKELLLRLEREIVVKREGDGGQKRGRREDFLIF